MAHEPHDVFLTVAVSPNFAEDRTVLGATNDFTVKLGAYALFKSTDGGVTWSGVQGLPTNSEIAAIVFSPAYAQDQTIYLGGSGGLLGTADRGNSWRLLLKGRLDGLSLSPNFAADGTLFVTVGKKILKSATRGQSWVSRPAPASLASSLTAVAVSPNYAVDSTLLLGSAADGMFESTDDGTSWVQVTSGLTVPRVTALAFSPDFSSDRTAYAGTLGSGLLVSTSGGTSWGTSNSGLTDLNVTSLALSPMYGQDSTLWVATATAGVFRSETRGAFWVPAAIASRALSNQTKVHYRAVAAAGSGTGVVLYLGMWEGLWTSSDGASSWQYIETLPTRLVRYIHLSPDYSQDQTVFANTYGGGNLWSTAGGSAWTFQNTGMWWPYTDAAGFSPNYAADGIAFSGVQRGLQRSSDRGATWQLVGDHTYIRALAVSPNFAQDSTLFIGTKKGTVMPCTPEDSYPYSGLLLSTDAGETWRTTSLTRKASASCWGVTGAAFSPAFASDRTGFAAASDGLYKSTDGGLHWTLLAGSPQGLAIVAVSPNFALDQTLFAAGLTEGILKSADGGATWSTLAGTDTLKAMDLQISPNYANDQSFFAATTQQGLVKFTSGGAGMARVMPFPDDFVTAVGLSPNFAADHTLFAAGYHGIFKSVDGGITWTDTAAPARIEESRNITAPAEQCPTITYQGSWSSVASLAASTNAYMTTSASGDTATLRFTGSGIRWVSRTGPRQGRAAIQLDGVLEGAIRLASPTDQYQQNVWERRGLACGTHTLTITALPPAGQSVSVDAFDVWVDTCPL
jgi:hypothetical protein